MIGISHYRPDSEAPRRGLRYPKYRGWGGVLFHDFRVKEKAENVSRSAFSNSSRNLLMQRWILSVCLPNPQEEKTVSPASPVHLKK